MQTLIALLVAAVAACAIARPPGPTAAPASLLGQETRLMRGPPPPPPSRQYLGDYLVPRMLLPHYVGYVESPVVASPVRYKDWLTKEIDHINRMDDEVKSLSPYEADLLGWYTQNVYLQNMLESPTNIQEPEYEPDSIQAIIEDMKPISMVEPEPLLKIAKPRLDAKRGQYNHKDTSNDERKKFALTPMDEGYYELVPKDEQTSNKELLGHEESLEPRVAMLLEPPRQTRQNPNLSKQKHLLEPDLGKLKSGLTRKEYRLPVSLLPANLRWLKVLQPDNVDHHDYHDDNHHQERSHEHEEGEVGKQHHVHMLDPTTDSAESIFSVALIAAVGAALAMAIVGFGFGWYTLAKRAKAAADVDYPAYGVTGPTVDSSGDRKLAHSAHMYHYQHQKQQIIAMERNGLEQRTGSVSDPESEEENEEGDYTVYECPGFATTGDMEVKNPLFSEDPTPVTPGRCEVVKQQPKD